MTKRVFARPIYSLACLLIVAASLGTSTPASASTYNGTSGTIDCSISGSITITSNSVTTHSNCSGSVEIPAAVTSIADSAFEYAPAVQAVTFQSNSQLTRIGSYAFSFAESLASVVIPANVTTIDDYAFESATSLSSVFLLGNAPSVGFDAFSSVANGAKAIIKPGATGFASIGQTWNGLIVEEESFSVSYDSRGGSSVDIGSFSAGGSIQNEPSSTRSGYTFLGWSTSENGSVIEFPYSPAANADFTLYARWQLNNGEFKCSTGVPLVGDDTSPTYTITGGVLSAGEDCVGAVVIPSGVTSISDMAFSGATSLSTIYIPNTVTSIGNDAFLNCRNLTSIDVDSGNANYMSVDGTLLNKAGTLLIQYPMGSVANSYTIPSGVTSIADYAFYRATSLSSVSIPASVTTIGVSSFDSASALQSVTFSPNSQLGSIGRYAFYSATALTSIDIPHGVITIGYGAFAHTSSLASVTIPATVVSIGTEAFANTISLTSVAIPASVTSIGDYAFYNTPALTSIEVDAANGFYTSKSGVLFNKAESTLLQYPSGLNATTYTIPASVSSIGVVAFLKSRLSEITIPSGVLSLGDDAFAYSTSLASVTIADGSQLSSIGHGAFYGATALSSIALPATTTSISAYAFYGATSLNNFEFLGNAPSIGNNAFVNVAPEAKAYVKHEATGFAEHGETWNGLVIERAAEEVRYSVSYNSTGGTSVDSDLVTADGLIQEAPVSTRTGHTLLGWSTSEDGSLIDFPFDPEVNSDVTLYAIWSLNTYEISFNSQGGSAVASRTLSYGQQLTSAPTSPTRSGYVFAGWSTAPTGSVISFPFTSSGYVDKTLHAKWNKKASVTASKPTVSGKAASTKAGSNKLTLKPGVWTGIPSPTFTYQWYLCTAQVKAMTSTIPKSCKAIAKQTKTSLAVVTAYKGKYLAVKVTGTSAGTTPTTYLTASSAKVS